MRSTALLALSLAFLPGSGLAQPAAPLAPAAATDEDVDALVERLARVGRAFAPTFSPDGKHVALISDLSGVPQVWIVPAAGGWPRLVTTGNDPSVLSSGLLPANGSPSPCCPAAASTPRSTSCGKTGPACAG